MNHARTATGHPLRSVFAKFTRTRLIGGIALCLLILGTVAYTFTAPPNADGQITLQAPAFGSPAYANELTQTPTFPSDIGISAYFKAPNSITIGGRVTGIYRTIEAQTDDYIVGSVAIEGYGTDDDVHVYIHKDGWVLAFYRSAEPASKIFDWKAYTDGSNAVPNKLTKALATAAGAAGVGVPATPSYYHFQYPEANRMTIALQSGRDSFTLRLPSGFTYYETSYTLGTTGGELFINDERVANVEDRQFSAKTSPVLLPEKEHSIRVRSYYSNNKAVGAVLVIYKEQ
jgi:hypothetical protein